MPRRSTGGAGRDRVRREERGVRQGPGFAEEYVLREGEGFRELVVDHRASGPETKRVGGTEPSPLSMIQAVMFGRLPPGVVRREASSEQTGGAHGARGVQGDPR